MGERREEEKSIPKQKYPKVNREIIFAFIRLLILKNLQIPNTGEAVPSRNFCILLKELGIGKSLWRIIL